MGAAAYDPLRRVSAHVMAHSHDPIELATGLRSRFGAGAVQVFCGGGGGVVGIGGGGEGALLSEDVGLIERVVHLSAPASGTDAPHGSPPASVFFFTGSRDADGLSRCGRSESAATPGCMRDAQSACARVASRCEAIYPAPPPRFGCSNRAVRGALGCVAVRHV